MELLFFAYRDFTAEADAVLADFGFGRAHHRAVYFIGRNPGLSVNGLLGILRITKQSLSRVLRQLIEEDFIVQRPDRNDKRRRLLYLTGKGGELEARLTKIQSKRIAKAYQGAWEAAGGGSARGFRAVLRNIINEEDRHRVGGE
ncbi:MAG: MarR family transcriptional regulator [Rhodospirillales bacterium]